MVMHRHGGSDPHVAAPACYIFTRFTQPTCQLPPVDSLLHDPDGLEESAQSEGGQVAARVALCAVRQLVPVLGAQVQGGRLAVQLHQLDARLSAGGPHFSHTHSHLTHSPRAPLQTTAFGKQKLAFLMSLLHEA